MKSPVVLLRLYLIRRWVHLSVIQDYEAPSQPNTTINRTYFFNLIVYLLITLQGTIGLHLDAGHSLGHLRDSAHIYWRQMFLRQLWPQMDIAAMALVICNGLISVDFTLKRSISWQYRFVITEDTKRVVLAGKALSAIESTKLLTTFNRSKLVYQLSALIIFTFALLTYEVNVFLINQVYSISFLSLTFWILGLPYLVLDITLFCIANLIHIIISGSCIQIRQQYLCGQLARLIGKLNRKRSTLRRLKQVWPKYLALNRTALSINLQLEAFNTFYTNYLTVVFLMYNIVQVMFAYVVCFNHSKRTIMMLIKCFFVVCIFEMSTLLFGIIQYCARVVVKNGQIGKLNRAFAVHCLRGQRRYRLRVGQLLKMELLQWPRLLHFYAFKLFGDARITSKTFYAMAINISAFFLFVTKQM